MSLNGKIIQEIRENPGILAKEIAKKLGLPKKEINSLLYGELIGHVKQDEGYGWIVVSDFQKNGTEISLTSRAEPVMDDQEGTCLMNNDIKTGDDDHSLNTSDASTGSDNSASHTANKNDGFSFDSLESVRKKLLDLTGRNTLLNYKHPRASCVRIIDELPDQIFEVLTSRKSFTFIPVPEPTENELLDAGYIEIDPLTRTKIAHDYPSSEQWAKHLGLETSYDLPAVEVADDEAGKHQDTKLQTILYAAELDARLRNVRSKAETAIEESGGNILFLALGFLEWFETRESDTPRLAPLFTIPVRLERDRVHGVYRYKISPKDDGLLTNITLLEKLAFDFNLVLPLIDEDESTPEIYFQNIRNTILREQPRWRLRRQATLVLLNYSKQAMYQDLNPDNWPEGSRIDSHELIKLFFGSYGSNETSGGLSYETEHPIDSFEDIHENFPLIYDADSSQHSALIDAVNGNNLVIEGPPGSGKSQTITNLISACIANGQKVLFVAEKMAALNVVKSRLDKAGLGDFCLELHSHKTHKLKILQDLTQRLNKQSEYRKPDSINSDIQRYEDLRIKLQNYAEAINSQWRNTALTIHEILNKATRYREHFGINPDLLKIFDVDGQSLTQVKQKELLDKADMLADIYDQVSEQAIDGVIANHYWYGVKNPELMGYQIEELNKNLVRWTESLESLGRYWEGSIAQICGTIRPNISLSDIQIFKDSLGALPELRGDELLSEIEYINTHHNQFCSMLSSYKTIHQEIDILKKVIKAGEINKPGTTVDLSESLKALQELGVPLTVSLDSIIDDMSELGQLISLVNTIYTQFRQIKESIPTDLEICFEVTPQGLREFSTLVDLINRLPPELWRHREEIFDNPDLDALLSQLSNSLRNLTPIHKDLIDQFSLHRLPDSRELIEYQSIFDSAGMFSIFSSHWRKARRSVLGLSAKTKPDKRKLLGLLPALITYAQGIEEINELNKEDHLLNDLYRGIETPIDRIIELRKWYQSVRAEYGVGFGDRVSIGNALVVLDRNLAISIADVANHGLLNEVDSSIVKLGNLLGRYTEVQVLKNHLVQLNGDQSPLIHLKDTLSHHIDILTNIVIGETIDLEKLLSLNRKLKNLHGNIPVWLKSEVARHFVPKILPLSVRAGEYSEKYYTAGTNTALISRVLSKSEFLRIGVKNSPSVETYNKLRSCLPKIQNLFTATNNNRDLFLELGQVDFNEWTELSGDGIKDVIGRNHSALKNPNWLNTWLDYLKLREKLYSQGLKNIIEGLESEKILTKDLKDIVQLVVFHQLSEEIFENHSHLSEFSGMEQMAIRKKYQEYDRKLLDLQRQKVAFQSSRNKPKAGNFSGKVSTFTETALIKHEAGKRSRHIALRSLLKRSGNAIQTLKPCFMMSPMSVAQYLEPGKFEFDLVVMDEASQIRPEDALGSIARGSKLVVVGDPKQLPPTTFFSKTLTNEDDEDAVALEESESILEAVMPMFKTRRLRWHYRSRHESLIAFSNQHFYNSNLILFPSPFQESEEFGIRFKKVSRGRFHNRRNVEEAKYVVHAAAKQLINSPDESVGIVAMNSEQQAEIELQLDQLAKDDQQIAGCLDQNRSSDEPLFIKNLENVQGDERDVIIISMTYGPEQVGGRTMQRFGPINSDVGWRRLNVLFTRSKKRMHIFSSMGSGDILVSGSSSKGVQSLRYFLEYCETGHMHHAKHTGRPADSDFEIAVMKILGEHGYECEPQLGVAGYYLDLAVRDPGQPGHFLMGVECDGATYHSAKSTRDRDRLRQDILENLGWRIRRIWSTDWFKNPQAQIQPIIQELDRLKTPVVKTADKILEEDSADELKAIPLSVQDSSDSTEEDYEFDFGDDVDLKSRLIDLKETIQKTFADTDEDHRLLRPAMIEAILNHLPCSKAEFLETIPNYLRTGTNVDEAQKYLEDVLEIVADYG